jgi:hypothetical protein
MLQQLHVTMQHVYIQQPIYKTEDLTHPNSNTNDIKEKLSLCTSGSQRDIAPHILNLGTTWRKVVSFTNTIICHNKYVVLYVVIYILLLIIILDFIFGRL